MAATQRLELRQSQSLVMTPQLQQAIRLLQLSSQELAAEVEAELERNPLLEREEENEGSEDFAGEVASPPESASDETAEAPLDFESDDEGYSPSDGYLRQGTGGGFEEEDPAERVAQRLSLRDHLLAQIHLEITHPVERLMAQYLLDALDADGYLRADLGEMAQDLGVEPEALERLLPKLQKLEPTGVFARDLKECLALQLAERDRLDPCMGALLENLHLLAERDYPRLRRLCGVEEEDFTEMLAELRALDPRPALGFSGGSAEPILPDVLLRARPGGGWIIELNPDSLPRVLVRQAYYGRVLGRCRSRGERDFVTGQFQSASWLVKALHQRAQTILKVASEVVRRQENFFLRGVQHLKPLTLREVAEAVELHESTVSRVTSNKFIATPRGTFLLKYFFTAAITGRDGEDHSAEAVRHRIRALIERETAAEVLSDDAIVLLLRAEGVEIARRTVAKYREAMHIPSSVQRRREKALAR